MYDLVLNHSALSKGARHQIVSGGTCLFDGIKHGVEIRPNNGREAYRIVAVDKTVV